MLAPGLLAAIVLDETSFSGPRIPCTLGMQDPRLAAKTVTLRSTHINFDMILNDYAPPRKTRIAVTIGPSSRRVTGSSWVAALLSPCDYCTPCKFLAP